MILIDTSLLIDYFRGKDSTLNYLIESENLAICGIILAELLHGINSENEKLLICDAIADFEWISIDDGIWNSVGNNLNLLRKNGLNIPFQDAILSTLCIEKNLRIATKDKHFKEISNILPKLQVYPEA